MSHIKQAAVVIEYPATGEWGVSFTSHNPEAKDYVKVGSPEDAFRLKGRYDRVMTALSMACRRIEDGPQEYHEANTGDGWMDVYLKRAEENTMECVLCQTVKHVNEFATPDVCNACEVGRAGAGVGDAHTTAEEKYNTTAQTPATGASADTHINHQTT